MRFSISAHHGRFVGYDLTTKYSDTDSPFSPIDTQVDLNEVITELDKATDALENAMQLIKKHGGDVSFSLRRMHNLTSVMTNREDICLVVAMLASYWGSWGKPKVTYNFRTEYEQADVLADFMFAMLDGLEDKPGWIKSLLNWRNIVGAKYVSKATRQEFRIAALAMNLVGFIHWRKVDVPENDTFGVIALGDTEVPNASLPV